MSLGNHGSKVKEFALVFFFPVLFLRVSSMRASPPRPRAVVTPCAPCPLSGDAAASHPVLARLVLLFAALSLQSWGVFRRRKDSCSESIGIFRSKTSLIKK